MSTAIDPQSDSQRSHSWGKGLLAGILFALFAVALAVWLVTGTGLLHLLRSYAQGTLIRIDQPTVVRQIQQLQRLETVSFTMDKIISGEHENPYLPKFLAGDRLLLVVHGDVIAGVDLGLLQPQDVTIKGKSISLRIPKAQILITRLDNSKTRVYSRDTGLFSSPDPNLESEVRQEAERQLQQAALQDNILKTADDNARATLSALLKSLGFTTVEFA
ncbi:MAG TPA: DUF4230 domain-containing protein [Candidatus Acidoferrum sp.]|nr:DUF4230 domain-containing protein [Candidatus Acidoferrum sp.]